MSDMERKQSSSKSRRLKKTLAWIGVFVVVFASFAGVAIWDYGRTMQWWGETKQVREYKSSPLTTDPLLGYQKVYEEQSQPVGFMGKRSPDWYKACYDPGIDSKEVAIKKIVAFAVENGFYVEPRADINLLLDSSGHTDLVVFAPRSADDEARTKTQNAVCVHLDRH